MNFNLAHLKIEPRGHMLFPFLPAAKPAGQWMIIGLLLLNLIK